MAGKLMQTLVMVRQGDPWDLYVGWMSSNSKFVITTYQRKAGCIKRALRTVVNLCYSALIIGGAE